MQIRLMQIVDYPEVYGLWSGTKGMGLRAMDDSPEGIAAFLKRNPHTSFVARGDDGLLLGAVLCGHDGRRGYIYHTAVRKEYRRQGIGKKLVQAVLSALEHEGICKAALVVYRDNLAGNAFWESIAFTVRKDLVYRNVSIREQ